jgi:hypothetical protein
MTKPRFAVTTGPHNMPSLELRDPEVEEREFLKYVLACNLIGDEKYELSQRAGAFLQSDSEYYVLVEFWQPDHESLVQWLNDNYDHWVKYWENGEMK